ncbi:MAG: 4Fe-4S dicluster domain [Thermoanaerobacteraceae bacterium]|jgi:NAD-dependent dihydropyrimidine dehydrogenase PreA subunit|uniref:4Fe-4S dicluster domain-containing protein n=1 Tax=Biomaibacter acetigenes TaxID=2316383 RepID=A0A3G2R7A0_9FIRM|nr:4Fe-4S dicluster-binding protein [Biomaibacter acetigenes]AYO31301.1 4Fe-4S dicluster domain-containing protein [Biomaibacter acetigenes]MDK2879189.1 4Fe-4S dicluster domain [Thermoanaerobacteraceae bacterium]MDN5311265.1 4Fe-4S dicluster domain [Thermoanaerobacteraceae bacterium]RKL61417.1 4Fe-4S dicluster domain-containing protein [Thermoanaerobacteraceae bacterium SP2]
MPFIIKKADCIGCGSCFNLCPYESIAEVRGEREYYTIDQKACMECSLCFRCCPVKAVKVAEQECSGGETID